MKKLSLFLALALPLILSAKHVDPTTAQKVAQTFLKVPQSQQRQALPPASAPKFANQSAQQLTPDQQFYVYQNPDGGYVIIAADDVARPILGYSHTGSLDMNNLPDNLRWWLSEYDSQIRWAQDNNIAQTEEIAREWQKALTQTMDATPVVGPLVETYWGQGYPYNEKCPSNAEGQAVTGCVATALAQVLRYWSWPEQGLGSHKYTPYGYTELSADFGATTYNWSKMPIYYAPEIGFNWYADEREAVATLMLHCGISVNMMYGKESSGAYTYYQHQALMQYFRYDHKAEWINRSDYSRENWLFLIKDQLNNHQPVLYDGARYEGDELKGHAFICDGYNSEDYFHFNWGWEGVGFDTYYSIDAMINDYNFDQTAIIHIIPQKEQQTEPIQVTATLPSDWGSAISAWVWTNTSDGHFEKNLPVKNGKVEFESDNNPLNIIFVNGTNWKGDNNQTEDITVDRNACITIEENTEGKRYADIHYCPHDITLTVYPPTDWKTISAWVWTNSTDGHWVAVTPQDGEYKISTFGERLNAVIVKGNITNWADVSDNNLQTVDISISNDAYVKIGSETSGKRSFTFQDMPSHFITVRAKKPADWGATISAYIWEFGKKDKWVTLTQQDGWYSYTQSCSRLNIIFVNGAISDWSQVSDINNQTVDIVTEQDACYYIGTNAGKREVEAVDCKEADQQTGVDETNGQQSDVRSQKIMRDGHLYILRDGKTYNAQGARVE